MSQREDSVRMTNLELKKTFYKKVLFLSTTKKEKIIYDLFLLSIFVDNHKVSLLVPKFGTTKFVPL